MRQQVDTERIQRDLEEAVLAEIDTRQVVATTLYLAVFVVPFIGLILGLGAWIVGIPFSKEAAFGCGLWLVAALAGSVTNYASTQSSCEVCEAYGDLQRKLQVEVHNN